MKKDRAGSSSTAAAALSVWMPRVRATAVQRGSCHAQIELSSMTLA